MTTIFDVPIQAFLGQLLIGLINGSFYAMLSLGLAIIFGLLRIINFAHGALLTLAMFAAWGANAALGLDPYAAIPLLVPLFFALGYALQRLVIGPASRGDDGNILLVTLGLAILIENALLAVFRSDTRTLPGDAAFEVVEAGPLLLSRPRLIGFAASALVAALRGGAQRQRS